MRKYYRAIMSFFTGRSYVDVKNPIDNTIRTLTLSKRDSNGFSTVSINNKPSKLKMLTFTTKEIERLQSIGDKIREDESKDLK
jgi:hypothetical protein